VIEAGDFEARLPEQRLHLMVGQEVAHVDLEALQVHAPADVEDELLPSTYSEVRQYVEYSI